MKKKNIFQLFLSGVICLLCTTSCSVEPDFLFAGGSGDFL